MVGIDSEWFEMYFKTIISKSEIFPVPKMTKIVKKMAKSKNFGRKIFLVGIDSECFETYFNTKISKSKIFSHYKIFSWDLVIFAQNDQNIRKMTVKHY